MHISPSLKLTSEISGTRLQAKCCPSNQPVPKLTAPK